ncbi:ABC transporter permease [Sandaracinobacter sp. RS1-74]|uniref:ABC transporter permease n=1 Tax=Sandaracinobacteroides sayramensis TaxID=2913411 RepID=UPI001EDB9243|nr:ABC transporter permease [Sandaracinobacteroides sayramensis]MCG2841799.1 ABC transporter permease [Sandaracinobacteroides sayramensis]
MQEPLPRQTVPLPLPEPGVPVIHGINWLGIRTLYVKEVRRFFKVQLQTVWAPAATTLMFLAIFSLALGRAKGEVLGLPYSTFLAPGLIIMGMVQNSFQNSLSSILIAKVQGTIIDVLMPPLSHQELLFSYVAGAVTRAWAVGLAIWLAMLVWPGVDVSIANPLQVFVFGTLGALLLGLLGVLTGIWADKFDHGAAVTNFLVQPLTLLSGTFYAIEALPPSVQTLSRANPFFYMIDGFRAGFTGVAEAPAWMGTGIVGGLVVLLWIAAHALLKSGWKLRA